MVAVGPPAVLRVCLDQFVLPNGPADAYAEIVLDNSRGRRCEPLAMQQSSMQAAADDANTAGGSTFHIRTDYSHHITCSDAMYPSQECTYILADAEGSQLHKYSSSCDPLRSHCYSMPEYDVSRAQPLWCCDFDATVAEGAERLHVELWDEAKLGDDRLMNVTLPARAVLSDARKAGGHAFTLHQPGSPVGGNREAGMVRLWAGMVLENAALAGLARLERKKHRTQIACTSSAF